MANTRDGLYLDGDRELKELLVQLPERVIKKGLRRALSAAATPIVRATKAKARRRFGFLKKSIGRKVKTYSDGSVIVVIGAKRDVAETVGNRQHVPANYFALVEKGHGGPHAAPPHPMLDPAYQETKGQATAIAAVKIRESVESEAAKLGKK